MSVVVPSACKGALKGVEEVSERRVLANSQRKQRVNRPMGAFLCLPLRLLLLISWTGGDCYSTLLHPWVCQLCTQPG